MRFYDVMKFTGNITYIYKYAEDVLWKAFQTNYPMIDEDWGLVAPFLASISLAASEQRSMFLRKGQEQIDSQIEIGRQILFSTWIPKLLPGTEPK